MIEELLIDYLHTTLEVPVWTEEPESRPARYLIIQRTGGGIRNHIRRVTVAIQSYAESLYQAAALNERVISAMGDIVELPGISRCALNTEYNYTNTAKHQYRWQAVYEITLM